MKSIKLPQKLSQMTLGQLLALREYYLYLKDYEGNENGGGTPLPQARLTSFIQAIMSLTGISSFKMRSLQYEQIKAIKGQINQLFARVLQEYIAICGSNNSSFESFKNNVLQKFTCSPYEPHELEGFALDIEQKIQVRKNKKRLKEKKVYHIPDKPEQLPCQFWFWFLDSVPDKVVQYRKDNSPWEEWALILPSLARIAWAKDEPLFIPNISNETVVNLEAVHRHERIFVHLNALDAVQAFGFFLTTLEGLSMKSDSLTSLLRFNTKATKPKNEKNTPKDGDTKAT